MTVGELIAELKEYHDKGFDVAYVEGVVVNPVTGEDMPFDIEYTRLRQGRYAHAIELRFNV